jgi:signal peptidase
MQMKKTAKYTGLVILAILMVAAVLTYLAPHFDWRVDSLCSGSMEPQLKEGALVITRPVEPETIAVGDIITFLPTTSGDDPITHRVTHIETNSLLHFTTRGDANNGNDPSAVSAQDVLGKVCFHIPYLGYVTEFLKTPWGFVVALVIPSLAIVAIYTGAIWRLVSSERKKEIPDSVA